MEKKAGNTGNLQLQFYEFCEEFLVKILLVEKGKDDLFLFQ